MAPSCTPALSAMGTRLLPAPPCSHLLAHVTSPALITASSPSGAQSGGAGRAGSRGGGSQGALLQHWRLACSCRGTQQQGDRAEVLAGPHPRMSGCQTSLPALAKVLSMFTGGQHDTLTDRSRGGSRDMAVQTAPGVGSPGDPPAPVRNPEQSRARGREQGSLFHPQHEHPAAACCCWLKESTAGAAPRCPRARRCPGTNRGHPGPPGMGTQAEDGGRARRRLGRAVLAAGGRWRRCCYENMRGPCLKTLQGASYINRPFMALSCSKTGPFTSAWLQHGGVTRLKGFFVRGAWGEAVRPGGLGRLRSSSGAAEPHRSLPRRPARSPRCQHPPAAVPLSLQLPMGPEQSPPSPHWDAPRQIVLWSLGTQTRG